MMNIHYISPSTLPSRTANSVHVMMQCDGLRRAGAAVTLYARRAMPDAGDLPHALRQAYGINPALMELRTCHADSERGSTLRIALMALRALWAQRRNAVVLSRNLYASYAWAVLAGRPMLFETHQLELGPRRSMQRRIMTRPGVTTVVISQRLVECLQEHHGVAPRRPLVLHDAAPDGIVPCEPGHRRAALAAMGVEDADGWASVCGYFGQLYAGRGIEIIEGMARARPRVLFLVYGGNDTDIQARRRASPPPNLRFMGHVPHPVARAAMVAVDVLLMPYQRVVSIGVAAHDTARWMSPMKMFEYMAAGVPLISSDLPVLREVLRDGTNSLLAPPDDVSAWVAALDRLAADPALASSIGACAHAEYRRHHTWTRRGEALLAAAQAL
jgi:hypothetical protein